TGGTEETRAAFTMLSWPTMTLPASISDLAPRLQRREISPVEILQLCLERIERLNPELGAFITVLGESARAEAGRAEGELLRGEWRGPLHGVPIALKDLIDTAGGRGTPATPRYKAPTSSL